MYSGWLGIVLAVFLFAFKMFVLMFLFHLKVFILVELLPTTDAASQMSTKWLSHLTDVRSFHPAAHVTLPMPLGVPTLVPFVSSGYATLAQFVIVLQFLNRYQGIFYNHTNVHL